MVEGNKHQGSPQDYGLDELALESAREISGEAFNRLGDIMDAQLTKEEEEQEIEKLLEEINIRGNEIYQRKKQERSKQ